MKSTILNIFPDRLYISKKLTKVLCQIYRNESQQFMHNNLSHIGKRHYPGCKSQRRREEKEEVGRSNENKRRENL